MSISFNKIEVGDVVYHQKRIPLNLMNMRGRRLTQLVSYAVKVVEKNDDFIKISGVHLDRDKKLTPYNGKIECLRRSRLV